MSIFKETKDAIMLLITIFVLTLITGFFYLVLGSYDISEIDVSTKEAEIVALRTLKCLEKEEKLDEYIRTNKYGIKLTFYKDGKPEYKYVDKELYEMLRKKPGYLVNTNTLKRLGKIHPLITVIFEK